MATVFTSGIDALNKKYNLLPIIKLCEVSEDKNAFEFSFGDEQIPKSYEGYMPPELKENDVLILINQTIQAAKQSGIDMVWRDHKYLSDREDYKSLTLYQECNGIRRRFDLDNLRTLNECVLALQAVKGVISVMSSNRS